MIIVKIEDVDVNTGIDLDRITERSLKIVKNVSKKRSLSVKLFYRVSDTLPLEGQDITIFDDATLLFGGIIKAVKTVPLTPEQGEDAWLQLTVTSDGYNYVPQRRTIDVLESNTNAGAVVTKMIDEFLSAEGVTAGNIETGASIDDYNGRYKRINEVLDDMANISGFTWNIDDNKVLNFEAAATPTTSSLSIVEGERTHFNFQYDRSLNDFRNKQFVEGGLDDTGTTVRVVVEDSADIAARAAAENNTGVYGNVYRDTNIQSTADAISVANELLNRYQAPAGVSFNSYIQYELGKFLPITYSKYNISTATKFYVVKETLTVVKRLLTYSYTAEGRNETNFSGKAKDNAIDFFSNLSKPTKISSGNTTVTGGYKSIEDSASDLTIGTSATVRSIELQLLYISDIMDWLTIAFTTTAAGQMTVAFKLDDGENPEVTIKSFTFDYDIGQKLQSFSIPRLQQPAGDITINVELSVSTGTITVDDYVNTIRYERYVVPDIPEPEPGEPIVTDDWDITTTVSNILSGWSDTVETEVI